MSFMLTTALDRAIAFLISPLVGKYQPRIIIKLQHELHQRLGKLYAPSWFPTEPLNGSGRRALTLGPGIPPRPIYDACTATGIKWDEWIKALGMIVGAIEFSFFVDPGCVSVRCGTGQFFTIWSDEFEAATRPTSMHPSKTLAQEVLEADSADDLFAMIENFSPMDEEAQTPNWLNTTLEAFPVPPFARRSRSPTDSIRSTHSRSSSFSSLSSASGASFSSVETDASSVSSLSSSPRRHCRSPVFIDASKKEVTPYDGGKTTVLTGGVMLGAKPATGNKPVSARPALPMSWRTSRF